MSPVNFGWTVEYQTANGDWRLAMAGRHWKTKIGAVRANAKWLDSQREFAWEPLTRVIELVKSYNHVRAA